MSVIADSYAVGYGDTNWIDCFLPGSVQWDDGNCIEYFGHIEVLHRQKGALCDKVAGGWHNKVQYYLQHGEEADISVAKLKRFLEDECSEENDAKKVWEILIE